MRGGGCAAQGAEGASGWRGARGHRFFRFDRVGTADTPGHHRTFLGQEAGGRVPLFQGLPHGHPRAGAPSNSTQPPLRPRTPALPDRGEPRTHVRSGGGGGSLSRLSLKRREWREGIAAVLGRRMERGVLAGAGGDAVSHPPSGFWAAAHACLRSGGAVGDVRLGRPLHLPSIPPPGRRASPLNAREPEPEPRWLCGCRSARAAAVPARHKRRPNRRGAGAHEKGRAPPRGCPEAPRAPARVGLGAAGQGRAAGGGPLVGGDARSCVSPAPMPWGAKAAGSLLRPGRGSRRWAGRHPHLQLRSSRVPLPRARSERPSAPGGTHGAPSRPWGPFPAAGYGEGGLRTE